AIAAYRKALVSDPKHAMAHTNLGVALQAKGDAEGALAAFHQALACNPTLPEAHGNLGALLLSQGRFTEARQATRAGPDLLPTRAPRRPVVSRQLERCEALLALDEKLPAVLRGDQKPDSAAEALELAWLCARPSRRLYHASAQLYRDALAAGPMLADD